MFGEFLGQGGCRCKIVDATVLRNFLARGRARDGIYHMVFSESHVVGAHGSCNHYQYTHVRTMGIEMRTKCEKCGMGTARIQRGSTSSSGKAEGENRPDIALRLQSRDSGLIYMIHRHAFAMDACEIQKVLLPLAAGTYLSMYPQ